MHKQLRDIYGTKIDIKNSGYVTSRKIKEIQRLFEKNILRAWDESLLSKAPTLTPHKKLPDKTK